MWKSSDAKNFNKSIKTDADANKWAKRANGFLAACQSGKSKPLKTAKGNTNKERCEASAIIIANSAFNQKEEYDKGQRLITFSVDNLKESIKEVNKEERTVLLQIIQGDNSIKLQPNDKDYHNGWSKNLYYYSWDIIEKLIPFVERSRKMYMDHKDTFYFGRSMQDWTGTIVETPKVNDKCGLIAKVKLMSPPNQNAWIFEAMQDSPEEIGVSIDAIAYTEEGERHGIEGRILTQWVRLNSADFVTEASAKGKFIDFSEALSIPSSAEEIDHILHELGYLESYSLDSLTEDENTTKTIPNGRNKMELNEIKEVKIDQLLAAGNVSVIEALKTKGEEVKSEMQKEINTLKESVKTSSDEVTKLKEKVSALEKEKTELVEQVNQFKLEKEKAEISVFIEETRKKYEIDSKFIKESFKKLLEKSTKEDIENLMKEMSEDLKESDSKLNDNPARGGDNKIVKESDTKKTDKTEVTEVSLINAIKGKN